MASNLPVSDESTLADLTSNAGVNSDSKVCDCGLTFSLLCVLIMCSDYCVNGLNII